MHKHSELLEVKPNHLRIGNYLQLKGEPDKYSQVEIAGPKHLLLSGAGRTCEYKDVEYVRTNEYWLRRFGFSDHGKGFFKEGLYISEKLGQSIFLCLEDSIFEVNFIHQLQNAWFLIRQEEIEIIY